ncbi:MAG: WbqC family protein [Bacteroidales bacterium]|nr:WbqC family protein [Bacteroidales bacterium]
MAVLLSIAYFPPISYFALIAKGFALSGPDRDVEPSLVYLEAHENYQKQTWRNRFRFYAADGPQILNFPIVHESRHSIPITEVKVDYKTPWVVRTERAIDSAYESSAFFEYYRDELFSILDSHPETLFDLDLEIIRFFLRKTGIPAEIRLTDGYGLPEGVSAAEDYRERIHPKRPDTVLSSLGLEKPYFQVFARKYGFVANLSILDLLFNEGPESLLYLKGD